MFYGDYLINAQGEDVVAGIRTPIKLSELDQADARGLQAALRRPRASSRSTTRRCRTSSSPSRTRSSTCCSAAPASARPRRRLPASPSDMVEGRGSITQGGRPIAPHHARGHRAAVLPGHRPQDRQATSSKQRKIAARHQRRSRRRRGQGRLQRRRGRGSWPPRARRSSWSARRPAPRTSAACTPPRAS